MQMDYNGRKRSYSTAFVSSSGGRNTYRVVPTPSWGNTATGYARRRGQYNGRRGNYLARTIQRVLETRTNPVYPRPEKKFFDVAIAGTAITSAGVIFPINQIPQGILSNNRIGAQVATSSTYYNYVLTLGTTPLPCSVRIILFWDREPNAASPSPTALLIAALTTAPMNLLNRNRFVILDDDRDTLSPNGDQIRFMTGNRKIDQLSTFQDATGIPNTGGLFLLVLSDQSTAANQPIINATYRVRFMDN